LLATWGEGIWLGAVEQGLEEEGGLPVGELDGLAVGADVGTGVGELVVPKLPC
jgi:hypothetical protein